MKEQARTASTWTGRLLFVLMVGAAGCITWYGMGMRDGDAAMPPGVPMTLAMLPGEPSPLTQAPADGATTGLPTRLVVGAASIDAPVQGVGVVLRRGQAEWDTAWAAVGHHIDSALPGQPGNVVFTGHVSVANHSHVPYFANLDTVQVGDVVEVFSGAAVFQYRVDEIVEVDPDDVRVLRSDHRSRVTLITCTRDLKHRLVVSASLVKA